MHEQDYKFFQVLSLAAAASVGISVTFGAFLIAAAAVLQQAF